MKILNTRGIRRGGGLVSRATLFVGLFMVPAIAVTQVAGTSPNAVRPSQYAIVDSLSGVPSGYAVQWPTAIVLNDTMLIAANLFPTEQNPLLNPSAVILRSPGLPLSLPQGTFAFAHPKLLVDRERRVHLLWGEFDRLPVVPFDWRARATSIWHSEWAHGRWSAPEAVLRAPSILWHSEGSQVDVDENNIIHIVVPASLDGGTATLVHVEGSGNAWKTHRLNQLAFYASVIAPKAHQLVVAFVWPDTATPGDHGSVFVTRSADDGTTWSSPTKISNESDGAALSPQLVSSGATIHLAWLFDHPRAKQQLVVERTSTDGGRSWGQPVSAVVSQSARDFKVVPVACSGVAMLVEEADNGGASVTTQRWPADAGGAWSPILPNMAVMSGPSPVSNGSRIRVVFTGIRSGESTPKTLVAESVTCRAEK